MRSRRLQSPGPSRERAVAPSRFPRAPPSRPGRWCASVAEVALAGEDHRQMVTIGDLDRHLVPDRSAGLDDRRYTRLGGELDAIGKREVGVARHDSGLRPVAGPAHRDLDRYLAAGLGRADPDGRAVPGENDGVRSDVADGPPGEQQVVQLVEGRPALGHDLKTAAVEAKLVQALDQEPARDPLEIEVGDAVVAHSLG